MTSIAKQNTIEALSIYHKAQTNKWEVRVSESGNVRIASWTDSFSSGLQNFFIPNRKRTDWNEKAKDAITDKLTKEITSLQKETDKDGIKDRVGLLLKNIKEIKKEEILNSAKEIIFKSKNIYEEKFEEIPLENAFDNKIINENTKNKLDELWRIEDKKIYTNIVNSKHINENNEILRKIEYKKIFDLVSEELKFAKDDDVKKATHVANFAVDLINKFGHSKDMALNAARDFCKEMNEIKFDLNRSNELIKLTLDLVSKGHLDNKLPLKLQLSASLAFIQLTEKKIDRDTALTTVKNRIDKLKKIQNKIPKEMQIDCVHEGKDYEYRVSFSKEQKEKIAESLKTQLKEPLYKKNKVMEEKLKDLSNIHLMNRLDDQSILDGERSSSSFRENGKIISTLNSDPQSNPLKIEEKYESNAFIEVDEEYEIPQNTITNPDSNIRDIPESLLETKFLNPLKNFQIETKLNDKNLTDISHFLSQTTLGTLISFELEKLKSHVQSTSTKKRGETFYDVDFLTEKTKEGNKRIILKATKYEDGDSLMISNADPNDPSTTLLPINEFFNYEKDDKVGPKKFRQKMNVDFEIQINQNDEIQIRVIDAGLVNKFSIDYDLLDTTPIDEIFK